MTNPSLADVVPGLEALEEGLTGHLALPSGLEGLALHEVPAIWLVTEFISAGSVWPPAALQIAQLIVEHDALSKVPLGSLAPELIRGGRVAQTTPAPAVRILQEAGFTYWADLAGLTPILLVQTLPRGGAIMVTASAIREAAEQALLLAGPPPPTPWSLQGAVTTIATWAKYELGIDTFGAALAAAETGSCVPREVQLATQHLGSHPLSEVPQENAAPYDVTGALRRVLECDARARLVLERRIYPAGSKLTLDELGTPLGVTRERVRQIENKLRTTINARLADARATVIKRTAYRLRAKLGICAPLDDIPSNVAWALGINAAPDSDAALHARVLLSLAGPYAVYESWVIREPVIEVVGGSAAVLDLRLGEALIPLEEASLLLDDFGIPPSEHSAWLERVCKCRVLDETVLPWKGSMADKAAAVLQLRGEPLTGDELAEALGPETNFRSMINQIQSDPRFLRRGLKLYGLRVWGGEEYTTVSDEIEQEIERQGGASSLDHLVSTLCGQFGVSESSVRAYASSSPFVRTPGGLITIGTGEVSYVRRAIEDCRGCFRIESHWALRVVVDGEVLRGSGRQVPMGIPQLLGIRPDEARRLTTPVGDLLVRYSRQATVGSLRKAALHLACVQGDRLFVVFTGDATVDFVAIRAADVEMLAGAERLARELSPEPGPDPVAIAAYALGLPSDEYRLSAVRRRLVARKEDELLQLIANVEDGEADNNDDALLGQLFGLGE